MGRFFGNITEYERNFLTRLVARMNYHMGYTFGPDPIKYIREDEYYATDEHAHADAIIFRNRLMCHPGFSNVVFIVEHLFSHTGFLSNHGVYQTTDEDREIVNMFIHLVNSALNRYMCQKRCLIWLKKEDDKDCIYIQWKGSKFLPRRIFTSCPDVPIKFHDQMYMTIDPSGNTKYPYPLIYGISVLIDWLARIGIYKRDIYKKEYEEMTKKYIDYSVFGDKVDEAASMGMPYEVRKLFIDLSLRMNSIVRRNLFDYVCDDNNGDYIIVHRRDTDSVDEDDKIYIKWSDTMFFIYYLAYIPTFSEIDTFQDFTPYDGVFDRHIIRRVISLINRCLGRCTFYLDIDENWNSIDLCRGAGRMPIVDLKDPSTYERCKGDLTEVGVIIELMKELNKRGLYNVSSGFNTLLKNKKAAGENRIIESTEDISAVKYIVTPQMEDEYFKAYEAGDKEKATELLKEVFIKTFPNNKIGNKILFKGKNGDWTEDVAGYFTDDEGFAAHYGEKGDYRRFFLNMENPFEYDFRGAGSDGDYPGEDGETRDTYGIRRNADAEAETQGKRPYDGYILRNVGEGAFPGHYDIDDYIVNDPRNVWPADPFIFDKDGNLIPLSKRFTVNSVANESIADKDEHTPVINHARADVINYIIDNINNAAGTRLFKYYPITPAGDYVQFSLELSNACYLDRGCFISLCPSPLPIYEMIAETAKYFKDGHTIIGEPCNKKFIRVVADWICKTLNFNSYVRFEIINEHEHFCMYERNIQIYSLDISQGSIGIEFPDKIYMYDTTSYSIIWAWMSWLMDTNRLKGDYIMYNEYKNNTRYYEEHNIIGSHSSPWVYKDKTDWQQRLMEASGVSTIKTRHDVRSLYEYVVDRYNEIVGTECLSYVKDTPAGDWVKLFLKNGEGPGDDLDTGYFVSCFHPLWTLGNITYRLDRYIWSGEDRIENARSKGHDMRFLRAILDMINKCVPRAVTVYIGYEKEIDVYYIGMKENGVELHKHYMDYIEKGKKISHSDIDLIYHTLYFLEENKRTYKFSTLDGYGKGEEFLKDLVKHGVIYSMDKPYSGMNESIEDGMKKDVWNPMVPEIIMDMVDKLNACLNKPVMRSIYDPEKKIFRVESDMSYDIFDVQSASMYGQSFLVCFTRTMLQFRDIREKVGTKEVDASYPMDVMFLRRVLGTINRIIGKYTLTYGTWDGKPSLIGKLNGFPPMQVIDFSEAQRTGYLDEGEVLMSVTEYITANWASMAKRSLLKA